MSGTHLPVRPVAKIPTQHRIRKRGRAVRGAISLVGESAVGMSGTHLPVRPVAKSPTRPRIRKRGRAVRGAIPLVGESAVGHPPPRTAGRQNSYPTSDAKKGTGRTGSYPSGRGVGRRAATSPYGRSPKFQPDLGSEKGDGPYGELSLWSGSRPSGTPLPVRPVAKIPTRPRMRKSDPCLPVVGLERAWANGASRIWRQGDPYITKIFFFRRSKRLGP
jgi:hypothetical protein